MLQRPRRRCEGTSMAVVVLDLRPGLGIGPFSLELGCPDGIHQKQVDQMVIHSASDLRPKTALSGDYCYSYFARGFDVLFDGQEIVGELLSKYNALQAILSTQLLSTGTRMLLSRS